MTLNAATVVMAHGAWADGSSWSEVIKLPYREGIKPVTAPLPLTSLADDIERPLSPACITVPVGRSLWMNVPTWYLIAERDRMIAPQTQRFTAERMKARISAHPVDHTPSVTAPHVVADLLTGVVNQIKL